MRAQADVPKEDRHPGKRSAGAKKASRRRFLRALMVATPAAAAGGLLAGLGTRATLAKTQPAPSLSPEETRALRERFLDKGRMELGAGARVADRPAPGPGVETLSPGPSAGEDAPALLAAPSDEESALLRMQRDLQRAMTKPRNQRKWMMIIDLRKCIGCSACTIACKAENHLPPGVVYRPVIDQEVGEYPNVTRYFLPRPCMQCDDPPCTPVCPVNATWKRDDGIVVVDYDRCIGCRYCLSACPYSARYSDFGDYYTDDTPEKQAYEEAASPEYSKRWDRRNKSSPVGNARKCHFCIHRLDAGMLPACVTTCIGGATYFGDKNDSESLVNELISRGTSSGKAMRLKEELGTEPKVYYLL